MNDDWRLRIDLHEDGAAHRLTERLEAFDLAHKLSTSFSDRVVVTRDGGQVFCYTAGRPQADAVRDTITEMARQHDWQLEFTLHRWHPVAERWEDPEAPLPAGPEGVATEHAELIAEEREESSEQGFPEWEVRVRCASREDATALSETLTAEGYPVVHRDQFVVLGAADEDSARALATRVRAEAPSGSDVVAEASVQEIVDEAPYVTPFNSPFAVFGGLGG